MKSLSSFLVPGARVAVVGSREFPCLSLVEAFVSDLPGCVVVSGGARGVDQCAADAGRAAGLNVVEFEAEWRRFGLGAGPVRNQKLVDSGLDVLVCFVSNLKKVSKGSADVCRRARAAGVPVFVFGPDGSAEGKKLVQLKLEI